MGGTLYQGLVVHADGRWRSWPPPSDLPLAVRRFLSTPASFTRPLAIDCLTLFVTLPWFCYDE